MAQCRLWRVYKKKKKKKVNTPPGAAVENGFHEAEKCYLDSTMSRSRGCNLLVCCNAVGLFHHISNTTAGEECAIGGARCGAISKFSVEKLSAATNVRGGECRGRVMRYVWPYTPSCRSCCSPYNCCRNSTPYTICQGEIGPASLINQLVKQRRGDNNCHHSKTDNKSLQLPFAENLRRETWPGVRHGILLFSIDSLYTGGTTYSPTSLPVRAVPSRQGGTPVAITGPIWGYRGK